MTGGEPGTTEDLVVKKTVVKKKVRLPKLDQVAGLKSKDVALRNIEEKNENLE